MGFCLFDAPMEGVVGVFGERKFSGQGSAIVGASGVDVPTWVEFDRKAQFGCFLSSFVDGERPMGWVELLSGEDAGAKK